MNMTEVKCMKVWNNMTANNDNFFICITFITLYYTLMKYLNQYKEINMHLLSIFTSRVISFNFII